MSVLTVNGINVRSLNHSRKFASSFIHDVNEVAKTRLTEYLMTPLPCTGKSTPISVSADKYTLKHVTHQMTGIRHVVLANNVLFNYSYIDHPKVIGSSGEELAQSILNSLKDSGGLALSHLTEYM